MDPQAARTLLGLADDLDLNALEQAHASRREAIASRLATAPTEALKAKYQQALAEIDAAFALLDSTLRPSTPNLSHTRLLDLPSAQPGFTEAGSGAAPRGNASLPRLQPGKVLAQRYELRERIGAGGMGAVYAAHDRNRNEDIALKVLLPHLLAHATARERFLAEAKIASSLSHPGIVNVFDVQRDGDFDFLTMELLRGRTLREQMTARREARQPYGVDEALAIGRTIGAALGYAHRYTVHRDVKPENIWVDEEGGVKLMDFGIAKLVSSTQQTASSALGTAYYMAPEQLKQSRDVDGRADQYSLAVVVYELLSGDLPAGRIRPLRELRSDVPTSVSTAIDRALDPDPARRFPTMHEFVNALDARATLLTRAAALPRGVLVTAAVLAVVALVVVFGPTLRGLLPDREAQQQARAQAIQAQEAIETLLKRVEVAERDLDTEVRDARSAVDRYEGMVRMARSEGERADLSRRLSDAQATLARLTEVRDISTVWAFGPDEIANVRGKLALGATSLRDGKFVQAAEDLRAAQTKVETLLDVPDAARAALDARDSARRMLRRLDDLAALEKRDTDQRAAVQRAMADAEKALQEGRVRDAATAFGGASRSAAAAHNGLIDQLVNNYSRVAQQSMGADLDAAERAVRRAKQLDAMKVAVR